MSKLISCLFISVIDDNTQKNQSDEEVDLNLQHQVDDDKHEEVPEYTAYYFAILITLSIAGLHG